MQDECSKNTGHAFDVGGMYALSRRSRLTSGGAILSAEDFPARTSAMPAKEQVSPALAAACGTSSPASLAWFDLDSCSWRTWQRCLLAGWEMFSGRWPRSGTMRNGIAYRLPPLVPITSVIGCSCWPTPIRSIGDFATIKRKGIEDAYGRITISGGKSGIRGTATTGDYVQILYGGPINWEFIQWLMGFPMRWCHLCEPLETP
jgi:hypothetical protein